MFVSIYYKPSLFNAHTMILIVHIFMNVDKLCLNHKVMWVVNSEPYVFAAIDEMFDPWSDLHGWLGFKSYVVAYSP